MGAARVRVDAISSDNRFPLLPIMLYATTVATMIAVVEHRGRRTATTAPSRPFEEPVRKIWNARTHWRLAPGQFKWRNA